MPSTKRRPLLALLLLIVSTLVSIKVADILAGFVEGTAIWSSGPPPTTRSVSLKEIMPNSDTFIRPDARYLAGTQNLENKLVRLRTDSDGYIVGSNDMSAGAADVIFFGGSTTECRYVDESLRFPYLVSRLLKDPAGREIRSLNGGFPGSHSLHSLISLVAKGLVHRPKIVVLMENINDLTLLSKTRSYWVAPVSREFLQGQPVAARFQVYDTFAAIKNFLMPNLWNLVKSSIARTLYQVDEWKGFRRDDKGALDPGALRRDFHASLISFVGVARAWGSEPVLMTQFNRMRADDTFARQQYESNAQPVSYDEFVAMYTAFNETIREVARETKVLLIDLDKLVPPSSQYIYDSVHLNDAGSALVADIVSHALAEAFPVSFAPVN